MYPLLAILLTLSLVSGQNATKPPSIRLQPNEIEYFKADENVDLNCIANGEPKPKYEWRKNGELFDPKDPKYISSDLKLNRIVQLSGVGSLMMTEMVEDDAGIYQCFAKNRHGTSLSIKVNLIQIVNDPFTTVHEPTKISAILGDKLTLTCNPPQSIPRADVFWSLSGDDQERFKAIETSNRLALDYEGNLYFANVKREDEVKNKYLCMTWHKELRSYSEGEDKLIEIHGKVIGTFFTELMWNSDDNILGLIGETVKMKCIFAGKPTPTIEWIRIGAALDDRRMIVGQSGHELIIKNVSYADQGQYECAGINSASETKKKHKFSLRVQAKPHWINEPKDVDAGVEEDADFTCKADGKPQPTVQWFVNGIPIEDVPGHNEASVKRGLLSYYNVTKADSKVIQCNATNIHGSIWADVYLNVLALPPNITSPPGNTKVAEGHDVTLTCENTGKPTPKIYWKKGDQKIEGEKYVQLENGNLIVKNVTRADKGRYQCLAENRFGKRNATGKLTVRTQTHIVKSPMSRNVTFDKPVQFRCSATTDPEEIGNLNITWMKNGVKIDLTDPNLEQRPEGTLIIKKTGSKDTANYTCVASNGLDSDNSSASLIVKAPPDPPINVFNRFCETRSGTVEWTPGNANFVPIEYFIVEYNNSYNTRWETALQTEGLVNRTTVVLSPFANYTFRVRGVNAMGTGEPSNISSPLCKTSSARPDKHPENLRTVGDKSGVLIIEWDRMELIEQNGINFKYTVEITRDKDDKKTKFVIDDYTVARKEIDVGHIYELYRIHVKAQNVMGTCTRPSLTLHGHSGEAAPLASPQNFELDENTELQPNSAGFQWDGVDTSPKVMRGKFRGYKIRFWLMDDEENKKEVLIPEKKADKKKRAAKVRAVIRSLPAFTNLQLDVVAVNTYFESSGSNVINLATPEGAPGAVRSLEVLFRSSNHFLLEWTEPVKRNGIITGYDIGYQEINGFDVEDLADGPSFNDSLQRRASLQSLKTNQEYRLYVWARTSQGRGVDYYIDAKTTGPGPLASPLLKLAEKGNDFINVTWTFDRSNELAPIGYNHTVRYRKKGGSNWIDTPVEHLYQWQNISDLQPGNTYEVIVVSSGDHFIATSSRLIVKLPGGTGEVKSNILNEGWFIGMMMALALLVLILCAFIVWFIMRSRGDKYHVQEKERLRGTDPEANEEDPFNVYTKNGEEDPLTKGPDSFDNDTEKPPPESDIDSMAEYGDVDPSRFNEDGSFIGQYGAQKTPVTEVGGRETTAQPMSSFV